MAKVSVTDRESPHVSGSAVSCKLCSPWAPPGWASVPAPAPPSWLRQLSALGAPSGVLHPITQEGPGPDWPGTRPDQVWKGHA